MFSAVLSCAEQAIQERLTASHWLGLRLRSCFLSWMGWRCDRLNCEVMAIATLKSIKTLACKLPHDSVDRIEHPSTEIVEW
jgi:hypothetical protein